MNKTLNFLSPINSLSYGIVSTNFLKCLDSTLDVALFPISQIEINSFEQQDLVKRTINNAQLFDPDAPCLRIYHQNSMAERVGRGKFIGMPIFELDGFSKIETHHLSQLDHIVVNSQWAKKVVEENIASVSCGVVPLGVDTDIFSPTNKNTSDKSIFLNVGKMEYRKGHDVLIECFNKAFEPTDNAELWLLWENRFPNCNQDYWNGLVKSSKNTIRIIPRRNTAEEVAEIMNMSTCGIFLSRAEGYNLPLLEMMACGRPTIATDYSGHTQYSTMENADLIEISEYEPAKDNEWPAFDGSFNWAKITDENKDEIIQKMRDNHNDRRFNTAGIKTANELTWNKVTERLINELR